MTNKQNKKEEVPISIGGAEFHLFENKEWEERFDKKFELEEQGCSECGGFELVDHNELRYPKGKYHCEYDLDKIKLFISTELQKVKEETIKEVIEEIEKQDWECFEQTYITADIIKILKDKI